MNTVTLPRRRGIDGLRALAVIGVLAYHAGISWLPGGFLGVDVFFAVSGYLIASLLIAELAANGRISLRTFWFRRARRLLPAVGALLLFVTIVALVGAHDAVGRLRGDVLAAMAYVSNWWQIVRGETYFESFGRPPLLRHLWSLAVEEQLYIVLPVVMVVLGRRRRLLAALSAVAALGSLVLLNVVWNDADPSRAWFGTDTRGGALLIGVVLALLVPMGERRRWTGSARTLQDVVGGLSIVGLAALMATMGEHDSSLPRWGFALTGLFAGAAVVAVASPSTRLGRVLGVRPLVWVGTRSYAIYLWHWPVFVLTRPQSELTFGGWRLLAVRLLITGAMAELSWQLVEQPVRTGEFVQSWRALRPEARGRMALAAASTVAVLAAALGFGMSAAAVSSTPELFATVSVSPSTATTLAHIPSTTTTITTPTAAAAPPASPLGPVLAIGDSVMLAARDALVAASSGRVVVDAAVGRQVADGLSVLQHYRDTGAFAGLSGIVVHLGTNGVMSDDLFNRLVSIVDGMQRVVVLNVRVPRSWETQSNAAIDGGVPQHATMRLGDWHTVANQPGMTATDGVHPSVAGAKIYSALILDNLRDAPPAPATSTTTTTAAPPSAPPRPRPAPNSPSTPPPSSTTTTSPASPVSTLVKP